MRAAILAALLAAPAAAGALEISLVENRAESGSVGYVDIRRIFEQYPETRRAKDEFRRRVLEKEQTFKAEEDEIRKTREKLEEVRQDRSFVESLPVIRRSTAPPPSPEKGGEESAPEGPKEGGPGKPSPEDLESLPGLRRDAPEEPGAASSGDRGPAEDSVEAPAASTGPAKGRPMGLVHAPPVEASTAAPTAVGSPAPSGPREPGITREAKERRLSEIARKEEALEKRLAEARARLEAAEREAEAELVDEEKRQTRRLLARIYRVVQDVAVEEGISVVIDKESILFGQQSVDLTPKVLERL